MASGFSVERLMHGGQYIHYHSGLEIYGVTRGRAAVIISGESRLLMEGQMAIVDKYENHSIETEEASELVILRINPAILRPFSYMQTNQKLPRWLMDATFNKKLFVRIDNDLAEAKDTQTELRVAGMICLLLADIIEHYGAGDADQTVSHDTELVVRIIQYIYEHYCEKITLEALANTFHISSSVLSKKLRKRLGVDLRVFVNDLRVQKAVQMLNEPENKDKSVYEIAVSCGFSSMSTFYRCYKRNFSFGTLHETEEKRQ